MVESAHDRAYHRMGEQLDLKVAVFAAERRLALVTSGASVLSDQLAAVALEDLSAGCAARLQLVVDDVDEAWGGIIASVAATVTVLGATP